VAADVLEGRANEPVTGAWVSLYPVGTLRGNKVLRQALPLQLPQVRNSARRPKRPSIYRQHFRPLASQTPQGSDPAPTHETQANPTPEYQGGPPPDWGIRAIGGASVGEREPRR